MGKCNNCGAEVNGNFCPECGATIEPTKPAEETQQSAHDKELEEKIKRDWYIKTWQTEHPKENKIRIYGVVANSISFLITIVLAFVAYIKYDTLNKTLLNSDPLLLLNTYNSTVNLIYALIAISAFCLAVGMIIQSLTNQWTAIKITQWHDNLKIDKQKIAADIVLSGKSHKLYNDAVYYLYYRLKKIKPIYPQKAITEPRKSIIGNCVFSFLLSIVGAVGACVYIKHNAEKTLENIIKGVPAMNSSSDMYTTIILIILLTILIALLLIVPKIGSNKRAAFVEQQIKNGSLK